MYVTVKFNIQQYKLMSTGRGEADSLTLLLHAGLLKRLVERANFIFMLVNVPRKYHIVFSRKKICQKLCIDFSVVSQRGQGQAGSLVPGVCTCTHTSGILLQVSRLLQRSKKAAPYDPVLVLPVRKKLSENKKTHQRQSSRQVETSLCRAERASLCSETLQTQCVPSSGNAGLLET